MKDKRKEVTPMVSTKEIIDSFIEDAKAVDPELEQFEKEVKESFHEFKAEATIPKLRVREAPSSDAEEIDSISKGQSVTIVKVKGDWGKTKFGDGWVNLKYTRRV